MTARSCIETYVLSTPTKSYILGDLMNTSGASQANQATWIETQYLSSEGNRKTLKSLDNNSEKAAAVKFLSELECPLCNDVYEKTLQTRCCDYILCADCYSKIPVPKKCPNDRLLFTDSIQNDLKTAVRQINNQVERCVGLFSDVQPTEETDTEKRLSRAKSQAQNDAIQLINSGTSQRVPPSTSENSRQSAAIANTGGSGNINSGASSASAASAAASGTGDTIIRSGSHTVRLTPSSVGNVFVMGGGSRIVVDGGQVQVENPVNRGGVIVSGQNVNITQAHQNIPAQRTHDFRADDVLFIDIKTSQGNIVLEGQNSANQNQVSVISTSAREPRLGHNRLYLYCAENVRLKLPDLFSSSIQLHTQLGDIVTENGYIVKSGGTIQSDVGNISVKVDSLLVNATARTSIGRTFVNVQNQHVDWERRVLNCVASIGNVNVYDQG